MNVSGIVSVFPPLESARTPEQAERRRRVLRRRNGGLAASATLAVLLAQGATEPLATETTKPPRLVVTAASLADEESRANIARLFRLLAECDARTESTNA